MRNENLYIESTGAEQAEASLAPRADVSVCEPEEGLRLVRAFCKITDRSRRAWLIAEAEKISRR